LLLARWGRDETSTDCSTDCSQRVEWRLDNRLGGDEGNASRRDPLICLLTSFSSLRPLPPDRSESSRRRIRSARLNCCFLPVLLLANGEETKATTIGVSSHQRAPFGRKSGLARSRVVRGQCRIRSAPLERFALRRRARLSPSIPDEDQNKTRRVF
jgi:hypothetical protein